jgi:predicted ATPase with chaperone activity
MCANCITRGGVLPEWWSPHSTRPPRSTAGSSRVRACSCQPPQIQRYIRRISGPLLDRIDVHVEVPRLKRRERWESASL